MSSVNAISPFVLNIHKKAADVLDHRMETIINSRLSLKQKSSASSCHSYYSDLLQAILKIYATDLERCLKIEHEQFLEFFNEGQLARETITKSLNTICDVVLEGCKAISNILEFFDCVDRSGAESIRGVWKASKDSSDNAAPIRKKIHDIKYQTGRCASEAERVFISETALATENMMICYAESEEKDQIEELEKMLRNHNEF
ncbi:uncharacterized protein LOC129952180 isoform X2 [Eupeodes corollae]|uniref:uncharacterized protein LOC129952180 isoform X2 n=1 Tax=Eupeodes corollae TaxID=290404 RepID=UPI00248F6B0E|nr:uncharacterized protein LOC129952180 isoform X2 [Eupeodes corollae]